MLLLGVNLSSARASSDQTQRKKRQIRPETANNVQMSLVKVRTKAKSLVEIRVIDLVAITTTVAEFKETERGNLRARQK